MPASWARNCGICWRVKNGSSVSAISSLFWYAANRKEASLINTFRASATNVNLPFQVNAIDAADDHSRPDPLFLKLVSKPACCFPEKRFSSSLARLLEFVMLGNLVDD